MRRLTSFIALTIVGGLFAGAARLTAAPAAAASENTPITGVLIDQACGAKMMEKPDPEKAAEGHPRACAMKDSCAKSGYAVISGKDMIKFDDNGDKLAKDFLENSKAEDNLRVQVEGTRDGDQIKVTSIKAAPEKG